MARAYVAIAALLYTAIAGCGNSAPPSPVGVWTVRHELKQEIPADADVVLGFSTSTLTVADDGTFIERLQTEMFQGDDPPPVEYLGGWKQDGKVVRFKRDEGDATDSFVLDDQGLRMSGNVAGYEIVFTRQLDEEHEESGRD